MLIATYQVRLDDSQQFVKVALVLFHIISQQDWLYEYSSYLPIISLARLVSRHRTRDLDVKCGLMLRSTTIPREKANRLTWPATRR
ncbi:hypothetical protein ACQKWADRAFT_289010 [Trichoderma austrokoningii]